MKYVFTCSIDNKDVLENQSFLCSHCNNILWILWWITIFGITMVCSFFLGNNMPFQNLGLKLCLFILCFLLFKDWSNRNILSLPLSKWLVTIIFWNKLRFFRFHFFQCYPTNSTRKHLWHNEERLTIACMKTSAMSKHRAYCM